MVSYKTSVARKFVLFGLYDRQWSLTKPRSPNFFFCDCQWSVTKPRSPKYILNSFSMIVITLFKSLGRLNMRLICFLWSSVVPFKASVAQKCVSFSLIWSSLIFYKASVAHICFFFKFLSCYRQWYLTKPRLPKYVSYIGRFNDHQWSLTNPRSLKYMSYLNSMISYYASVAR